MCINNPVCINMVNGHNQCVSIWLMDITSVYQYGQWTCVSHNQCVSIWSMDITSVYQYGGHNGINMVNGHNQCVSIWLMDIT